MNKMYKVLTAATIILFVACSLNSKQNNEQKTDKQSITEQTEPHQYGGWYCPDNLNGFPAVNIKDWKKVPVIIGRMPTEEDVKSEASLIFVDPKKYPNAKPLDMEIPRLARYYNYNTKRNDYVIIIQAFNIGNDSIVGYRFLNGGNGSARLQDMTLLDDKEIEAIPASQFVTYDISIQANRDVISKVMTGREHAQIFQPIFDKNTTLAPDWRNRTNVNFYYVRSENTTSAYADILFGNFYVQNDYIHSEYTEKFLLLGVPKANTTTLKIVCGPFVDDYEAQKDIIVKWAKKVKELSEM